ncbi:hypothetical protein HZA96_02025 [Candidatus Woesearchaeota archaeon]|nr:hypothetical protein [Candidatus Woesearchaeota archaeon]
MKKRGKNKQPARVKLKRIPKHSKLHRERSMKDVDDHLPAWKERILIWNEKHFGKIELIVERTIPFLVIILLFIIIAEFGDVIGHFFEKLFHFAEAHHTTILYIDYVIIGFFIVDLYFAFFKKSTLWRFFKAHFVDIIAIIPVTVFLRIYVTASTLVESVSAGQKITHVLSDVPKVIEATRDVEKLVKIERALKIEEGLAKGVRLEEGVARTAKGARFFSRLPRIARLLRLRKIFHVRRMLVKERVKELKHKDKVISKKAKKK